MKERPILFSAPMVRAILAGNKTQTRRIVKFPAWMQDCDGGQGKEIPMQFDGYQDMVAVTKAHVMGHCKCQYGVAGDRLWVRETHFIESDGKGVVYRERGEFLDGWTKRGLKWRSPIFMPRWASRITLEVVAVRVERLQDITNNDAMDEGFDGERWLDSDGSEGRGVEPWEQFRDLWHKINGADSWTANPWVWVVEFRSLHGGAA